ncbi:tryptophan halogenase family protein [Thalassotalea sp. PS06]|uniref:tryptophan halogenase family protein n=1 Tax=Thalassotalea sp. PS06 TaxID=2594005 RepID=UPI0011649F17|nr:tryptophan halogenase family protein [Thalassotalea sp. PS06]QDP02151.1 tryptophan 7-halogenase [Thalassotalea sp. PS06]
MNAKSTNSVKSVLIVGGGTAGWLSACYLAKQLNQQQQNITITLVESPDIPIIGVGEGTWPTMRTTLQRIGIDESRFIRECDVSFKQASKFVNWHRPADNGKDNFYYHLFDGPGFSWEFNPVPFWLDGSLGDISFANAISLQEQVCQHNLAPKMMVTPQYQGVFNYAYHLDAGKFGQLLKTVATEELGVNHISANVTDVHLDDDGDIAFLSTDRTQSLTADLFIDCSGFKSLLLGEALNVPFKDLNDVLFVDRAVTIQAPYEDQQGPIASQTISTAQEAGWIWDIGLQSRRGTGYVYASKYSSPERAEQLLREYLGDKEQKLEARHLQMRVGHRQKFWEKNCVAIGLSAAFMEPLEASAIFLVEAACFMLAEQFPKDSQSMSYVRDNFNDSFAFRWQKTVEFIKMHYVLSERDDTPFWRDNKHPDSIPEELQKRLSHWLQNPVSKYDFASQFEPFTKESYEFILYGMRPNLSISAPILDPSLRDKAQKQSKWIQESWQQAQQQLPTNRELLNRLKENGFQKL